MNNVTENCDTIKQAPRDYLFDNMRAILIILVVWGHTLTNMAYDHDALRMIYYFLFFFHMPAMIFISGYFSKNVEKNRNNAFIKLLVPYLILNVVDYIYKIFILHDNYFGFRFFQPSWGLWYLLALFIWKFFLKDIIRIRFVLPLSFLFALLSGYSKEFSEYMALGRVVNFLPFFLLGYFCTKEYIEKIRRIPKLVSVVIIMATAALSIYIVNIKLFGMEVFYLRKPYPQDQEFKRMLFRLLVYIVAIAMTIAVINLTSSKKGFLSAIGTTTVTIYVLHLFAIPALEKLEILKGHPYYYIIYSVIITAILTFVFSRPLIKKIYDYIIDSLSGIIIKNKN